MPLVDMPMDQLLAYGGRNPKPADFDAFWDDGLAELDALDADLQLVAHPFDVPFAECFHLYFSSTFGARIHAKFIRPKSENEPHPAVLSFHGYSGSSGDWTEGLKWAARGFAYAALDCRGQAGQSVDMGGVTGNTLYGHIIRGLPDADPTHLYYRNVFLDTAQLARVVMAMDEVNPHRVAATGWSQGGGLTLACAALEPRIKMAAPVYPFLCDYLRVWEMDLDVGAYRELREYFRNFDPLHGRAAQTFEKLGYIDAQHLAPRIRAKSCSDWVSWTPSARPPRNTPPTTRFHLPNKPLSIPILGTRGLPRHTDTIYEFLGKL